MPEPITRTIMEKFDVPNGAYETVVMVVEMAPHVNSGLHTHPGFDAAYLLSGSLTVLERGQSDKPIQPGKSGAFPRARCMRSRPETRPQKVLAIYVVEKGKPLATPFAG